MWPPINWEIAAHLAYDMFYKIKNLILNLVFPTMVFGVGITASVSGSGISFCLRLFLTIASVYLFVVKSGCKVGYIFFVFFV